LLHLMLIDAYFFLKFVSYNTKIVIILIIILSWVKL